MGRFLSFDDLPAITPDYSGMAKTGVAIGSMISEALQNRAARRQQAEQAQQRLQLDQSIAAQNAKHDAATLSESSRHNQALEADSVADREAQIRAAKATAIRDGIKTAVESGGNPEVVKALNAQLAALGGGEGAAPPTSAGSYPGQLSHFPDAELGHFMPRTSALLEGPAQPAQSRAQAGASDTPTWMGAPSPQVGTFDAGAIRQSLMAPPGSLQGISEMPATLPIVRDRRAAAVKALEGVAFPNEAARIAAINDMANAAERNETSIVNAAQQREAMSARAGASQGRLQDSTAHTMWRQADRDIKAQFGVPALQQRLMDARRSQALIQMAKSGDPSGLSGNTALGQLVRSIAGTRYSNADLEMFQQAFGKFDTLEQGLNNWFKSGQRTEFQLQALGRVIDLAEASAMRELESAGNLVRDQIVSHPSLPNYWDQDTIRRYGEMSRRSVLGGPPDPAPGHPSDGDDAGGGVSVGAERSSSGILAFDPDEIEVVR